MELDVVLLSRLQFALTIGFHYIFPPITIGLAWLLVMIEAKGYKSGEQVYEQVGIFFGKLLGITFVVGVASGIVMEFQFGTNWATYSEFVGDLFGGPLAAEGIFAFFLESTFLGLYLFGRHKVSRGVHLLSTIMVALGATLSAFWIVAANSWQQTPSGFIIQHGRAELTNFWEAVFNPSTLPRYFHTVNGTLITGAFFMAGIAAYLLLKNKASDAAKISLRYSIIFGLVTSILAGFPTGHEHARQVARTQPEKFAAQEGLYTTQEGAPMLLFGLPKDNPPEMKFSIEIPGLLSWIAYGDVNATVRGINDFPEDERPPLFLTFASFHTMVGLGVYFVLIMLLAAIMLYRKTLWHNSLLLKVLVLSIPLPWLANQLGWVAAEVGRQPWIVYGLLKTRDAYSITVSAGEVLFSLITFGLIYLLLGALYIYLLIRNIKRGPEPIQAGVA
ncbi:MAG: cytochrome ubiquinol oxidase subunit I [Fidelibacterota bacterium]|nr:MAG: cytochrome ubiquinol oxidase subunit I [Candidatus Neomarinimicrobiota bacterium]